MRENKYKELITILGNAPEGSVFWDGEDYLNNKFEYRIPVTVLIAGKSEVLHKTDSWIRKHFINVDGVRRLSDIKEIVDLMEKVAIAKVYTDRIIEDLGD